MKPASLLPALILVAVLGFGLCLSGQAASDAGALPVTPACFVNGQRVIPVQLEVARSPAERQHGLMERDSLDADAGMLFVYRELRPPEHGFWMYNTRIPLDIAYLDDRGTIVSIRTMEPCPSTKGAQCPSYPAGTPFLSAVEMNAGFFSDRGIAVGDRLLTGARDCAGH